MRMSVTRAILLATAFALAACGGAGRVAFIPPAPPPSLPPPSDPPPPAQTDAIVAAAVESQQFAAVGESSLGLESSGQLQVRYVATSDSYEVKIPEGETWDAISILSKPDPGLVDYGGNTAWLWVRTGAALSRTYQYSALFEWADRISGVVGHEAIGMATPASSMPAIGRATYYGDLLGVSSEQHGDDFSVDGSVTLLFDFAAGSLTGSITPNLHQGFGAITLGFTDTVYSTGSTTFSGKFDTDLPGENSFSGLFTGPNAQELIGNFAFPYRSPNDNLVYYAGGAFVARNRQ